MAATDCSYTGRRAVGSELTVTANVPAGYELTGWAVTGASVLRSSGNTATVTLTGENVSLRPEVRLIGSSSQQTSSAASSAVSSADSSSASSAVSSVNSPAASSVASFTVSVNTAVSGDSSAATSLKGGSAEEKTTRVTGGVTYKQYIVKPDGGYRVADVAVDSKSIGAKTDFTVAVNKNTVITVTFEKIPAADTPSQAPDTGAAIAGSAAWTAMPVAGVCAIACLRGKCKD